jgi:tripartite-type tricarboxylate transporter receptor subunit TctC
MARMGRALLLAPLLAALTCWPALMRAEPSEYFHGKTITIYVGNPPGGGYDLTARLLARHLGAHLRGHPNVVVSDMPGAHGITEANFLFNTAAKDGTALGAVVQYLAQFQIQDVEGRQYDAARFGWIGSVAPGNEVMYAWHTVPIRSIADLATRETVFATYGPGEAFARMLTAFAGARFKLVKGYRGSNEAHLAMERGEVEAAISSLPVLRAYWSDWLKDERIRIFLYQGFTRHPDLPDVAASIELAKTPADRDVIGFFINNSTIGRAFAAPPDLSPDVLGMLRSAFDATVKDEEFLADCRASHIDVNARPGDDLEKLVGRILGVDASVIARIREIVGNEL